MTSFVRIGWIVLIFWAVLPIPASGQSANDVFNLLDRVLRQVPDAGGQPPPADQTVRQPDRRVAPAEPAPRYQTPRYARADVRERFPPRTIARFADRRTTGLRDTLADEYRHLEALRTLGYVREGGGR